MRVYDFRARAHYSINTNLNFRVFVPYLKEHSDVNVYKQISDAQSICVLSYRLAVSCSRIALKMHNNRKKIVFSDFISIFVVKFNPLFVSFGLVCEEKLHNLMLC